MRPRRTASSTFQPLVLMHENITGELCRSSFDEMQTSEGLGAKHRSQGTGMYKRRQAFRVAEAEIHSTLGRWKMADWVTHLGERLLV